MDGQDPDGVLVVGELARTPRYQGAGSSQVNPTRLDDALSALRAQRDDVAFEPGYTLPDGRPGDDASLLESAVEAARGADTVVVHLGLPAPDESEGYDRPRLGLPENQVALLHALAAVTRRVVVVLAGGSVVEMPWRDDAVAVLVTWLGGQAGGSAVADVLTGAVPPSGRLAETVPLRLEDTPAFGSFPGEHGHVRYGEGVLVGYRWYDTRRLDVAFPFGHGLTYTTFGYDDVSVQVHGSGADVTLDVDVRVTNLGARAGAEVVQVYVRDPQAGVVRPARELKAFTKLTLGPGESTTASFTLTARDLSYWHPGLRRWVVEGGAFVVEVGASSRDVRGALEVDVEGEPLWGELSAMSTIGEWLEHPRGAHVLAPLLAPREGEQGLADLDETMRAMILQMPARALVDSGFAPLDHDDLAALVALANADEEG